MNWLPDADLSYRLVRRLAGLPVNVLLVSRTGLPMPADDRQIWEWAKANGYPVITIDEDFYRFGGVLGFPPKVVMLRTGNQSPRFLAALLTQPVAELQALIDSPENELLELFQAAYDLPAGRHGQR